MRTPCWSPSSHCRDKHNRSRPLLRLRHAEHHRWEQWIGTPATPRPVPTSCVDASGTDTQCLTVIAAYASAKTAASMLQHCSHDRGDRACTHLATWQEVDTLSSDSKGIIVPIDQPRARPNVFWAQTPSARSDAREAAMRQASSSVQLQCWLRAAPSGFLARSHCAASTLIAALQDWITACRAMGLSASISQRHGGNVASIEAAFAEAYAAYSLFPTVMAVMHSLRSAAVTYYAYPDSVETVTMEPSSRAEAASRCKGTTAQLPDGRIGLILQATPDKGRESWRPPRPLWCRTLRRFSTQTDRVMTAGPSKSLARLQCACRQDAKREQHRA
jgi:creatinine amidohydrolase